MKQVLNSLLLVMILAALIFSIFIIVNLESVEPKPLGTVLTNGEKAINTKIFTEDDQCLEFVILYEGEIPRILLEGYVHGTVRPMIFRKNMLEILKYNTLEHLKDSIEYYITPMDSTFKISLIDTKYHLSPEVRELWDGYIKAKIEATKAEERAKNLEILYGE
jgi:hypothetical protein